MKISRIILLLVVGLMVMGCASFQYPTKKSIEYFTVPEIGVESTTTLGNPIITSASGYYADGIYVNNTATVTGIAVKSVKVGKGFYELIHNSGTYQYYYPENDNLLDWSGISGALELRIGQNSLGVVNSSGGYSSINSIRDKLNIEKKNNHFITQKESLQQTLFYTGKEDNILKFTYREFTNDMARPAFTTDITYDMNESNIIGYKSFRAEVLEASNTEISYKILSGF